MIFFLRGGCVDVGGKLKHFQRGLSTIPFKGSYSELELIYLTIPFKGSYSELELIYLL